MSVLVQQFSPIKNGINKGIAGASQSHVISGLQINYKLSRTMTRSDLDNLAYLIILVFIFDKAVHAILGDFILFFDE